jgi:hypothetical protein
MAFTRLLIGDDPFQAAHLVADGAHAASQERPALAGQPSADQGADYEVEQLGQVGCLSLGLDLLGEPRAGGPGIALEHGDLGVLALDGPGDVAEGPVADVPGEGAAHLAERQRPGLAVHVRDAQLGHVAEAAVRVGDEPPELPRSRPER